jgi:uncharacterized membrane-anchored protein YhcB (DUF1043 family)
MEILLIVLIAVVIGLVIFNVVLVTRLLNKKPDTEGADKSMQLLMQQMNESSRSVDGCFKKYV